MVISFLAWWWWHAGMPTVLSIGVFRLVVLGLSRGRL